MRPEKSLLSSFELERRSKRGHHAAAATLAKQSLRTEFISLLQIISALLLVVIVLLSLAAFGWGWGVVIAIFVTLIYGALGRLVPVSRLAHTLLNSLEAPLIRFIKRANWLFAVIRWPKASDETKVLGSREELEHLVHESADTLSQKEKDLIVYGLQFADKDVHSIMTLRSMIDSIKKTEMLGPLVLSELHDLGHSRLPVTDKDIDHIVGILHIKDLLTLDNKRTVTAEKAMETNVYYIHEHDSLEHALAAFLKTRQHLFIVVNEFRETVGLVTLEDVIEVLLGRRIVDEDDIHHDARAVAARNPRRNNQPPDGHDV